MAIYFAIRGKYCICAIAAATFPEDLSDRMLVMMTSDRVVSYQIVENMRHGMTPREACVAALERCVSADSSGESLSMNFVALDKQGRFGAAGTDNFPFSVATGTMSEVRLADGTSSRGQHAGGNVH